MKYFVKSPREWWAALMTRRGFFWWLVVLFWLKTLLAYFAVFNGMNVQNIWQVLIALLNPLGFTILLFSLATYWRSTPFYYGGLLLVNALSTVLLYLNVIYYREFSDYMTVNTMLGYSAVNQGTKAAGAIDFNIIDVLFWLDLVVIIGLLLTRVLKVDQKVLPRLRPFFLTTVGIFVLLLNLFVANIDRPQLLTRQFDREYLVKYLGLGPFTIYDGISTQVTAEERKKAEPTDLDPVKQYVKDRQVPINADYFGAAEGRNVIVIHLESLQQFVIDQKVDGQEIMPFLNKLYHADDTVAFNNVFHQVGQGKTSDAETLLETSTFGLPQGSLFTKGGPDQTFQAMPAILNQNGDYSSAVFHGNQESFWNRSTVYKQMGYQNFFGASYFDISGNKSTSWGLKDKLLFRDSIPYLEQLQQPFYAKYLTVTNHTPYTLDEIDQDPDFQPASTGSAYLDNYFKTNHYLDESIEEFFNYLKKSGLYEDSMIVFYGDHYGIPNSENANLAAFLGQDPQTWTDYNDAQMQRIPFFVHVPGENIGGVHDTYGGEVDIAPTVQHLLGINTTDYLQFGQDLLSEKRDQTVAFRNKDFVSPTYSMVGGRIYNQNGEYIKEPDEQLLAKVEEMRTAVNTQLTMSDTLNQKNLLRFYTPEDFTPVDPSDYDYSQEATLARLRQEQSKLGLKSTSLLSQNKGKTTFGLYETNAPEAEDEETDTTRLKPRNPDNWDENQN